MINRWVGQGWEADRPADGHVAGLEEALCLSAGAHRACCRHESELSSFNARLRLKFAAPELLLEAITHKSYGSEFNNARLSVLGESHTPKLC